MYSTYWLNDPRARITVFVDGTPADIAIVEISIIAVADGAERVVVHPSGWSKSPGPYSHAIKSGNTLFLAGLVSRNGKDGSNEISAQTKVVLEDGAAIPKEAGMNYADVVQAREYLTNAGNFQAMNTLYRSYFPHAPYARATVRTGLASPDYLFEIGMIAVKDASRQAITTPGAVNPNLSSAIQVGDLLFVSGIRGNTPANPGDARAQTAEALSRIARTVKAAGFDMSNVVEGMGYVVDMTKFAEVNTAYRETFHKDFPARTRSASD